MARDHLVVENRLVESVRTITVESTIKTSMKHAARTKHVQGSLLSTNQSWHIRTPQASHLLSNIARATPCNGSKVFEKWLLLLRGRCSCPIHTLGDSTREQLLASVGNEMELHRSTTCALAVDGNFSWVTTEGFYVFLDPLQSLNLVQKAGVGIANLWVSKFGRGEEAEAVESVVY